MAKKTPTAPSSEPIEETISVEELEVEALFLTESLASLGRVLAHHHSEVDRLTAENSELTASLTEVPAGQDGGAQGRYVIRQRILRNEYAIDVARHEITNHNAWVAEVETAIAANAAALITFRKDSK